MGAPVARQTVLRDDGTLLTSSVYFGAGAAALGATFNAAYATLKGKPVVFWTVGGGLQSFILGSTFWLSRTVLRDNLASTRPLTRGQELVYSTAAGSLAGTVGGSLRGVRNIIPGAVVFGLMGFGGQLSYTAFLKMVEAPGEKRPILERISEMKWSPFRSISDADYEKELSEKVIALEAEMAMIDERIASLKHHPSTPTGQT